VDRDHEQWRELARQLRIDVVRATATAGSGHPTSALSAADLMAVLLEGHLRYDFTRPSHPGNDRLIFSKGHAAPLLYAMFKAAGAISDEELLTLRRHASRLEGHPTPRLPWVDVATGSLGQGLPVAVGIALGARLQRRPSRIWVLCGDGELAEGSMWEAFERAGHDHLGNLIAIIDANGRGQCGATMSGGDPGRLATRIAAFGWDTIEIDGHDVGQIDKAYTEAPAATSQPLAIVARTVKGRGVAAVENRDGIHGKPLADPEAAIRELGGRGPDRLARVAPPAAATPRRFRRGPAQLPSYPVGRPVALRQAWGETVVALGSARTDVVVLDADVSLSTYTHMFAKAHPDRFLEMYVAEQQMVATAVGLQTLGYVAFASTFAAFHARAYDFVRMAAVGRGDLRLVGCYAGVSIGPDGPSQMGLEDLAVFRAIPGSVVLYPSDANQTSTLVRVLAERPGVSYLRVTRAELPVLYPASESFQVGGSRVLRRSDQDDVAIVAAGVTLHQALAAAEALADRGIRARVIDLYSIKPVDAATLQAAVRDTGGRLVTVEDHRPEGGLGDAVLGAVADTGLPLRLVKLGVTDVPGSGTPAELMRTAGIDSDAIVSAATAVLGGGARPLGQLTGLGRLPTVDLSNEIGVPLHRGPAEEPGRPVRPLADDLGRYYAVGVRVRTDSLVGVLVDVNGDFLGVAEHGRNQASLRRSLTDTNVETVVGGIADLVADLLASHPELDDPLGLGVELSGQVDAVNRVVRRSHRMGWREPVPLAELLEAATGHRTMVEHDTKSLVLAEQMFGLGQGRRSFAVVTAGFGIGTGLVINHSLWRGVNGVAGELGHLVVDQHGRRCLCGKRGCLETVAGFDGILQTIRAQGRPDDVPDIEGASRLAQSGEEVARRAFEEAGACLGLGLSWLVNLVDLELVIVRADPALLGSGVYVPAAQESFNQHCFQDLDERPKLVIEARDDQLTARSAGSMVFRLLPDRLAELGEPWD
jgi:transketolase